MGYERVKKYQVGEDRKCIPENHIHGTLELHVQLCNYLIYIYTHKNRTIVAVIGKYKLLCVISFLP